MAARGERYHGGHVKKKDRSALALIKRSAVFPFLFSRQRLLPPDEGRVARCPFFSGRILLPGFSLFFCLFALPSSKAELFYIFFVFYVSVFDVAFFSLL